MTERNTLSQTQEMMLEQLRAHSEELRQIRLALENLIRVEERQIATDTRIASLFSRCDDHDERIRVLESSSDKRGVVVGYVERVVLWVMATGFGYLVYILTGNK